MIPKEFASGTGISCKTDIKLKDQEGREWMIRVTRKNIGVFALTAGWFDFLVMNKVRVGSIMSFKFISGLDYTIEARVVKIGEKDLFKFVRRQRGRDVIVSPTGSDHATKDTPGYFTTSNFLINLYISKMIFEFGFGLLYYSDPRSFILYKQMTLLKTVRMKIVLLIEKNPLVLAGGGDLQRS